MITCKIIHLTLLLSNYLTMKTAKNKRESENSVSYFGLLLKNYKREKKRGKLNYQK